MWEQLVYNRCYFCGNFCFACVKKIISIAICIYTYVYDNLLFLLLMRMTCYVCDNLCIWPILFLMTTYVHNKLWFCANFVSVTTYKYFYNYYIILYVWQLTIFTTYIMIFCVCDNLCLLVYDRVYLWQLMFIID